MKSNFKIRVLAALLCMVTLFAVSCTAPNGTTPPTTSEPPTESTGTAPESEYPENGAKKIVEEAKTLYVNAETFEDLNVAYYEDTPEILLIDMQTVYEGFFTTVLSRGGTYELEETETTVTITRNNGACCVIDFVEDSIFYNDFDLFYTSYSNSYSDLLANPYVDAEGNSFYFKRTGSLDIAGLPIEIDLGSRNIPLDIYDGKKYMALQTFSDVFLSLNGMNITYNSKDLFLLGGGAIDPSLEELYYSIEKTEKSEALAAFNASELCLLMDLFYGLQDEHGVIVNFDVFLEHTGLIDDMHSTDAVASSTAIASLMIGYLADIHSTISNPSPYAGAKDALDQSKLVVDASYKRYFMTAREFAAARAEAMPDGAPGYQEIGNTAYITFDSFTIDASRFAEYNPETALVGDTLGLIIYAHSQITREGSPIENVVLDLSCNMGGAFDAAVYTVAWMLGYCDLHITNPVTNSYSTTTYVVDVNLDGVFDENDTIADKNLYCITSPVSFSCGNLVPSLLKESGMVTLIGGTSGGGACAVQHVSTADGTIFQISSPHRISVVSNGAYYTVDRGVEPHHYLGKLASYYDRDALTEFINNLK